MEKKSNNDVLEEIITQGEHVKFESEKEQYLKNMIASCSTINVLYNMLLDVQRVNLTDSDKRFFATATEQVGGIIDQLSGDVVEAKHKNVLLAQTPLGIKNAIEHGHLSISTSYGLRSKLESLLADLALKGQVDVQL